LGYNAQSLDEKLGFLSVFVLVKMVEKLRIYGEYLKVVKTVKI